MKTREIAEEKGQENETRNNENLTFSFKKTKKKEKKKKHTDNKNKKSGRESKLVHDFDPRPFFLFAN